MQSHTPIDAHLVGDELAEALPHLWSCLRNHAQSHPDRPAVKSLQSADTSIQTWTYIELYTKIDVVAKRLFNLGIQKGDAIVVFLDNRAEWALFFWVSIRLDALFVPLNPRMIESTAEVNHALHVVNPKVLLVLHQDDANKLERAVDIEKVKIRITMSESSFKDGWNSLSSFGSLIKVDIPLPSNALEQDMCVIFTSGTTSLPKASISTYRNFLASAAAFKTFRHLNAECVFLQHIPVFHAWSVCDSLAFWLAGGTVVYPSRTFDPRASLAAIEAASCTHMLAVPSMIQAMVAHPLLESVSLSSLDSIDLGGTMIFDDMIRTCINKLKADNVAATYGMTEGNVVCLFDTRKIPYGRNNIPPIIPCGTAAPGARLRVCKPDSRVLVKRGEIGEIHIGGLQVTRGYLDRESAEFYQEDGVSWLVTGDQARIDDQGMVYILGRYKDLIIRGGENLSPAMVEQCLNSIPAINDAQVIGIPDEVAGEVPVAVVKKDTGLSTADIQGLVTRELGKVSSPKFILDLRSGLALDDHPRTTSGKIKKSDLRTIVNGYLSKRVHDGDISRSTVETLINLWARVSGRRVGDIKPEECPDTFADSITMMQFCNLVEKDLHKVIAVEDLYVSISKQAEVVDSRPFKQKPAGKSRIGPPRTQDMVYGDEKTIRRHVELLPYDLRWKDVEDVFPADEKIAIMTRRHHLRSWNRRHAYLVPDTSVEELKQAVQSCLAIHPMFRSMIVDHDIPLYVIFRPNERWLNLIVKEGYEVDDVEDLNTFHLDDDRVDYAICPGPLFKFLILHVQSANCAALIELCHHSVFDAISMSMWHEDLDYALRKQRPPRAHADFKPFVERKYLYRDSPNTDAACAFHVSRLKGWSKHRSTLWPPQRSPQFFRGSHPQWIHTDSTQGKPEERVPLDDDPQGVSGIDGSIRLLQLPAIKTKYNITAQIIFKAALVLLNVHHTGCLQAFFGQPEASRVWPTAEGDPDPSLPNTMDIAGPAWEIVINRIHIDPSQPLTSFLYDLQHEQRNLSKYAAAPFKKVERLINEAGEDESFENEHELYDTIFRRQCFNWLPPSRPQYTHLRQVQNMSRADVGLQWDFMHVDESTVKVNAKYDDCQMRAEEVRNWIEELLEGARWIAEEMVRGEESKVGECPLLNRGG